MSKFIPERVREDYRPDIDAIRERHGDETIEDWIERYYASPDVDRGDIMTALQIDYIGTFYELIRAYDVHWKERLPVSAARRPALAGLARRLLGSVSLRPSKI